MGLKSFTTPSIIKLYDYMNYKMNNYSTEGNEALLLRNKKLFRYRNL